MTGRFYLDTEYTNGNYYLGDIFEIALISEDTCRVFHKYIKIPYRLSKYVKQTCNVSDNILRQKGVPFLYMLKKMQQFVYSETTTPILIAHGGFLCDFPL